MPQTNDTSKQASQAPSEEEQRLAALFEALPGLLEKEPALIRRGSWMDARFQVGIGSVSFDVTVAGGRISSLERGPLLMRPWRFAIRGTAEAWTRHWQPVPEAGWHDLFSLAKRGALRMEGDLLPLVQNLQYVKDLLALPRRLAAEVK